MREQLIYQFRNKLTEYTRLLDILQKEACSADFERIKALKEAEQGLFREITSFQKVLSNSPEDLSNEDRESLNRLYGRIRTGLKDVKDSLKSEKERTGKELDGLRRMRSDMGQSIRRGSRGGSPHSAIYIDILS